MNHLHDNINTYAVVLFTRIPIPGKTKTRLQPFLTGEECCLLQKAFLLDIFNVLKEVKPGCDIIVCYSQEGPLDELSELLSAANFFFPQREGTLGEKMHEIICTALSIGYARCLLIGSDLPLLKAHDVGGAYKLLDESDVVLCPTEDGGYYLVGMKEPCEELFHLEEYGVSTVFERTVAAAEKAGKTCAEGVVTMDIDVPDDLFRLAERLKHEPDDVCPETRRVLGEILSKKGKL